MDTSPDFLIFPPDQHSPLSIRAKALAFADPCSRQLLVRLDELAALPTPVVLQGEWGTGKELLARRLHERSQRSGLFVSLNCATLSRNHGAAELFGYMPRAYAGTTGSRVGWLGSANGGTLYLDEIADLSPALQLELITVLGQNSILRAGSTARTPVDVRLVVGSSVDLAAAVTAGTFSSALWALLEIGFLPVPPLRARPDDLLPLARHFLSQQSQRLERPEPTLNAADEHALLSYSWPGNIRELEQVLHTALLTCTTADLRLDTLLAPLHTSPLNYANTRQS